MSTNRIGIVAISLAKISGLSGPDALRASGNNFGNMLFTKAVYTHFSKAQHIGFAFSPDEINKNYSALIIPAANWISKRTDWQKLADRLEQITVPICAVGLGTQLDTIEQITEIPDGSKRFLKILSQKSAVIGVRGEFTKKALSLLDIHNAVSLGCPSIYMSGRLPELDLGKLKTINRVGIGPTRYAIPKNPSSEDKQRQLYQHAIRSASSVYYQSEAFEVAVLSGEDVKGQLNAAQEYYCLPATDDLLKRIQEKGKFHTDCDQWIADLSKEDFFIGTRVHGVIAALLAGTPAVLITHDNRTREMADTMGIPSIAIDDFNIEMLNDYAGMAGNLDFETFNLKTALNHSRFRDFYLACGISSDWD